MNVARLFAEHVRSTPKRPALIMGRTLVTFGELASLSGGAQKMMRRAGLRTGDTVVLFDRLAPRLYAFVIAAMSLGAAVVLIEPRLSPNAVNRAVECVKPRLFVAGLLGRLWGLRVPALRSVGRWLDAAACSLEPAEPLVVENVTPEHPGTVTFTSGTTGMPKAVVRTHGSLEAQVGVLRRAFSIHEVSTPDLCVFPAFVLFNLALGRPSLLLVDPFDAKAIRALDTLPPSLQPTSLACGPAVLRQILVGTRNVRLRAVHVGGAPCDAELLEHAMQRWPEAHLLHVYGSTEAEPVATAEGVEAVHRTRERGLWQVLYLGRPVPDIACRIVETGIEVQGPHVAPRVVFLGEQGEAWDRHCLLGAPALPRWHAMGDRVEDRDGLWFRGRTSQPLEEFLLEQERIYPLLRHSQCFVHRAHDGRLFLIGEGVARRERELKAHVPELSGVLERRLVRDRRHRARIDRRASLPRWLRHGSDHKDHGGIR